MTAQNARTAWFHEASVSLIAEEAKRLDTFLEAVADGKIDKAEVDAQQARLVKLMKEIEPLLNDELHTKVTKLLVELTAYDLMQVMYSMHEGRPKTVFRG